MSETVDEEVKYKVREFKIELELLIASMLVGVPLSAIREEYGKQDMSQIVAKVLGTLR